MALHSTNSRDTFITVAPDTKAGVETVPPTREPASVAELTHRMIASDPYRWTSDDVLFTVHADRAGIPAADREAARAAYFAEGRACLRSSPLTKTYGWGVHADAEGRLALHGMSTPEYARLAAGLAPDSEAAVVVTPAMRSARR